jgi:hypothetical protein
MVGSMEELRDRAKEELETRRRQRGGARQPGHGGAGHTADLELSLCSDFRFGYTFAICFVMIWLNPIVVVTCCANDSDRVNLCEND